MSEQLKQAAPTLADLRARRDEILALAEKYALAEMGVDEVKDWSTVKERDWMAIFERLIDFITRLLALFA